MSDFGDDIGSSVSRFLNMLFREWLMHMRYNRRNNGTSERVQGADGQERERFDCDSAEQQDQVAHDLKEEGIDAEKLDQNGRLSVTVPVAQMGTFQKLCDRALAETNALAEKVEDKAFDLVGRHQKPTPVQTEQIDMLMERGLLTKEERAALGAEYTAAKAHEILKNHKLETHHATNGTIPATEAQAKAINNLHDIGAISERDYRALGKYPSFEDARNILDKDVTQVTDKEVLYHAYSKGEIDELDLRSGIDEIDEGRWGRDTKGSVFKKLEDAGYDMNDLSKNDARMRPSHDGMDPDAHTQQVESDWIRANNIDPKLSVTSLEKSKRANPFAETLSSKQAENRAVSQIERSERTEVGSREAVHDHSNYEPQVK